MSSEPLANDLAKPSENNPGKLAPSRPVPSPMDGGGDKQIDGQPTTNPGARGCAGRDEDPTEQHDQPEDIAAHLQAYAGFRLARARALIRDWGATAVNRAIQDLPYPDSVNNPAGLLTHRVQDYRADAELPIAAPVAVDDPMDPVDIAYWDDLSPNERAEKIKFTRDFNRRYPEERAKNQGIPVKYLRNY
jgi:hypothetical protein